MSKHTKEFKEQIVALYKSGKSAPFLSKECDIPVHCIYSWYQRLDLEKEPKQALSEEDKTRRRLEKEIADLRLENEILKKAVLIIGKKQS